MKIAVAGDPVTAWSGRGSTATARWRTRTSRPAASPTTSRTRPPSSGSTLRARREATCGDRRGAQLHALAVEDAVSEHQRPKLDRYDTHVFLTRYAVQLDGDSGELRDRARSPFRHRASARHRAQGREFDIDASWRRWDDSPDLAQVRRRRSCCTACSTSSSTATSTPSRRSTTRSRTSRTMLFDERPRSQEVQRRTFELRKSLVLLRRVVLPMREVVNTLMRQRPARGRPGDDAVLPGRLRPRAARDRVDRVAARPGHHHPRDEPDHPGQPAERDHEEGDQLGGDHRGADRRHRLLRQNVPYPGFGHVAASGCRRSRSWC